MIDTTTNKPLRVATDGTVWPYIEVAVSQLDELQQLLDSRRIDYSIEEDVISFDGGPAMALVNLGRGTDADAVQATLDSVR